MSFLDDLEEDTPCLASFCPRCKDDPQAQQLRRQAAAETRKLMSAPRHTLTALMTQPRRVAKEVSE